MSDDAIAKIAEDLQTVVDEAREEVASSMEAAQEKEREMFRLDALESRLSNIEGMLASSTTAPEVSGDDGVEEAIEEIKESLSDIADQIAQPVEEPAQDALEKVDDALAPVESVIDEEPDEPEPETMPRRRHRLFKPLFGEKKRRDEE